MSIALFSSRKSANVRTKSSSYPAHLRRAAALGLGLLSLGVFGQTAHAGTVSWSGGNGSWFGSPSQWSNGSTPGTNDDVKNLTSALITLGQSTTIQSFFSDGAFDLTGGTFSGSLASSASTLQVNSTLTVNGGGIANFTINKGTGGSVVFSPSGGNFLSNDIVNADLDLSAPNAYVRLVNTNTFNGAISLGASGGDGIHLQDGNSTMILGKTGSLSGFGGVVQDGGGATITNNGTINANSAANALAFGVTTFNNVGTAEATNGATLNLNNTNTNAAVGSTIAAKGANSVVAIAGTFTGTGNNLLTATDGGQIQVNGASLLGTINTDANTALVLSSSGSNLLSGTTVNGNLNLSANTAYLKLVGADTVNGTISLGASGGDGLHLQDGNSVFVLNGTLVGSGGVAQDGGGAAFTNNGTVNANSVGNALTLGVTTFNNVGTAEATNGGTLAVSNTTTNNTGLLAATGGGVLDISGTLNSNAGNSINGVGGTVNIQGASLLGTINETAGTSLVLNSSGYNLLSGTTVNGNLDLSSSTAYLRLDNIDTVNGNISLGASGGDGLHLRDGNSVFTLNGSLTGFGGVAQDGGGAKFTNNGTVNANAVGSALNLAVTTFNNVGTTEATSGGTLTLNNTNTNASAGSTIAAKGANSVVSITGTFTGTGNNLLTASNGGQIQVNGASLLGTINTDANTALVLSSSGSNLLNGTTVNGNLNLSANTAYLKLVGADTVNGTISLGASGGDGLHLQDGNSVFTLNGTLVGLGGVVQDGGGATFTNNGTINANSSAGVGPLNLAVTTFKNNGMAEATNGGTLTLNNTNTNAAAGSAIAAKGMNSVVSIAGTFTGTGNNLLTATNGGQIQVNGASLLGTINTDANTALVLNNNGLNLLNNTTVNGNLNLSSPGATAYLKIVNTDTVNGNISLNAGSGDGIHLQDGNSVFVLNGSLIGSGGVVQDGAGATFTNNGTVNANTNGAYLTLAVSNFNNVGTAEATNSATLALNNTDTNASAGSTIAAKGAGSVVAIAGTFNGVGNNLLTATDGGQIQVNGASLLGTINTDANTALVFNNNGLNLLNNTTVNGNLDLSSPGATAYLKIVNTDTVNGNISLNASGGDGIHLQDGNSTLVLGKSGSLTGSGDVVQDGGGATILNKGTINANSVGLALNINTSTFTNTGTTEVQNGSELSVGGATADSGNVLVKTGGTATFSQGITQTGGLTAVDGTLNSPLTLTGGTLTGNGTVNGAVVNNGGTVKAGDPFGTLAVNGPFTQTTNGTLDAQFTQAQASLLAVTGVVTTGGALSVNYLGSVPYTLGSGPFTFLDYGTLGTESTNTLGLTQYFTNETALTNDTGLITGSNGFTYELLNNTGANSLQLQVLTAGTPAVPEASTTVSLGLLLSLGGAGLWSVKRCHTAAAR